MEKWWEKDITDSLCIIGLISIAWGAMGFQITDAKDILLLIAGGFIGYISKQAKAP